MPLVVVPVVVLGPGAPLLEEAPLGPALVDGPLVVCATPAAPVSLDAPLPPQPANPDP